MESKHIPEHDQPLVSVLMPSYNHEKFVAQAIESVFAQTYANIELIIIDDQSTDNTMEIIEDKITDSSCPVIFKRNEINLGVSGTLNNALRLANGEFICFLASDDFYHVDFVASCVAAIRSFEQPNICVHTNAFHIDEFGEMQGQNIHLSARTPIEGDGFWQFAEGTGVVVSSTLFTRKSIIVEAGGFDKTLRAEDFDFHLRISRLVEFVYLETPLFYARANHGSLGRKPWVWAEDIFTALNKHEDLIADRKEEIFYSRAQALSRSCFSHGSIFWGVKWWRRSLEYAPNSNFFGNIYRLGATFFLSFGRYVALRILPPRMVIWIRHLKRRLQAQ